jgi:hypothetical protein
MSDMIETPDTNSTDQVALEDMKLQDLRKLATSYQIKARIDWSKEDFINAINNRRQRHQAVAELAFDPNRPPAPGKARILIHNSQTGSNHPVPVNVNNYFALIPRDVLVDVPTEVLECLNNSKTPVRKKDPSGKVNSEGKPVLVWGDVPSYPYSLVAGPTPGVAMKNGVPMVRSSTNKQKHSLKEKFREIYQRWPKREEFKKFTDAAMSRKAERIVDADDMETARLAKSKE